jgi:hypothetical protein
VSANLDFSLVSEQYQPQEPNTAIQSPYSPLPWQVNQTWLLLPDRMVGNVKMTCLTSGTDKFVDMRIRTQPPGMLTETSSTSFTVSHLALKLYGNDFTGVAVGPCVDADPYEVDNADEIRLSEAGAPNPKYFTAGTSHTITLNVAPDTTDGLTGYNLLSSGSFVEFRAAEDLATYYVWYNTAVTSSTFTFTMPTESWVVLSNLFVSGSGAAVATPSIITGTSVTKVVPPNGSACIQITRNVLPNPGFEQVTSGSAIGYSYESLLGSGTCTTTIDSTSSTHNGNNSIKVTGGGSGEGGVKSAPIAVGAGKDYQVTVWYRPDSVISSSAIVCRLTSPSTWSQSQILSCVGGSYLISGTNLTVTASNPVAGTWNSMNITFGYSNTTLTEECLNWLGNGSVWFDDLSVMQVN